MALHCSPTMEGRRRELEVGGEAGRAPDKRKSEGSRLVSYHPPCLDADVPPRVLEEKNEERLKELKPFRVV